MKLLRENLVVQFSIASFLVMGTVAIVLAVVLSNKIRSDAVDDLVAEAVGASSGRLLRTLKPEDLLTPMTGERYDRFHNFVQESTRHRAFVHNGYAGLLFKYGFIGFALMMAYWLTIIRDGYLLHRFSENGSVLQITGAVIVAALIGELVVANTSTPFLIADGMLIFALLGGCATGLLQATRAAGGRRRTPGWTEPLHRAGA